MLRYRPVPNTAVKVDEAELAVAQAQRALEDRLEHRLEVGRRTADDAQDLAARRLLLQRLPGFIEQPRVLDRDDRLAREGLQNRHLTFRERSNLRAIDNDRANDRPVLQHRNGEKGPYAGVPH